MRCFDNDALTTPESNESLNNYKAAAAAAFFAFSTLRFYATPTALPPSPSPCSDQPEVESVSNAILLFML